MTKKKLPKGWIKVSFTSLLDIQGGTQPPKSVFIDQEKEGYIRLLQIRDFGEKPVPTYIPFKKTLKTCEENDILIARYGASIGRIVTGMKGAYNVALAKVIVPEEVERGFVYWLLKSSIFQGPITGFQRTAQNGFNKNDLSSLEIPLPSLPEQQRIVAKLDSLFARIEKLKSSMERIPQLLKDFRQAVLTQAVTGKLTEEWREGQELEPVSLISTSNKIEYELADDKKYPESWIYTALANYAECSRGKFTARPRNDPQYFDGEYPFMQIGDLPREGGAFFSFSSTLNEKGIKVSKSFPPGTVVIAIVGATIGNTGILQQEVYFPDSLIGINTQDLISNQFVEYYLRRIKTKIRELSYAGGGQPNIKLPFIKNQGIALPSFEEQQEIVRRIESLFAKANKLEAQYQTLKEKLEQLPQALLAKAFRGELVEQLPSDGDARELLEEIKKAKAELRK
ncbi:restriction endonuclease subunit S [Maribellus sediminis]|uniref:restriction endonuclease subunit S n=1 Tax=Maribellus sediminis TaxID=2696285 RepID=UPI001430903A|nr:restriction endonuclease subunit S [Maribellus sediminis]